VRGGAGADASLEILDAYPATARVEPGSQVRLQLEVSNRGPASGGVLLAQLRDNCRVVAEASAQVEVPFGQSTLSLALPVPESGPRGYEAVLALEVAGQAYRAGTAVLAVRHWREAPRYGFLSEFPPDDPAQDRVRALARFHITVVQFYDWMYRHYRFLPPEDRFTDVMGREMSLETVRRRVEACHGSAMAALAYGAVYGAEPEYVEQHPDLVLRDAAGAELSLIDLFYITDLRSGSAWREQILGEYEKAVSEVGFDGIHMDQYGFPKWSYDSTGNVVDLGAEFGGLIDEAAGRVTRVKQGAGVLFNAVNNWPVERVAASDQDAVYIEVWPPHDRYRDLVDLVRRARDLSGKHAVLAAYLEPFREGGEGAESAALLATAVIACAGGFHLLLGEGTGVLRDPYYPNHGHMSEGFARRMRRYYDHTAALHAYLFDPARRDVSDAFFGGVNTEISLTGSPAAVQPEAGAVWTTVRHGRGELVVNLVNLVGVADSRWNAPKEIPETLAGLTLRLSNHFSLGRVTWSSPDGASPDADALALELAPVASAAGTVVALPDLQTWASLVLELK
jgi:dextranase